MSKKYNEYLDGHIDAVVKAAIWMETHISAVEDIGDVGARLFLYNAANHDQSKYDEAEYGPYDAYFYGERDEEAFNYAWLHHIHNNPHHWQHWLLVSDDGNPCDAGKLTALEMPKAFALEMVADWWSFSWRSGNLEEVFDWYEDHKDNIILHPKTREFVESVLDEIREGLVSDR
jgi:hypothetical protein